MTPLRAWLLGALAGVIAVPLMTRGPLLFVVVPALCLIALLRPRFAAASGILTTVGGWFVFLWYTDRQRCLDMGPSCQFGDNNSTLVIAWALLLGGLALTALVARDARRA